MTATELGVRRRAWLTILGWGALLWALATVITYVTANPLLIPTLVLLGSFLIPVSFVAWAYERRHSGEITTELLFKTFLVGGVLGVLGASLIETYLLRPSPWMFFGVGFIEETVKLLALAWCTHHLHTKSVRDGVILGATVGLSFAAFESAGYALVSSFTVQGVSLVDMVTTELLRGVLSPLGHGVWTAIVGGVLFSASTRDRWVLTWRLIGTLAGVSVLHGLWDSMNSIAVVVTYVLSGLSWQHRLLELGYVPAPTPDQVYLFTITTWVGFLLIAAGGLIWLARLLRSEGVSRVH